MRFLTMLALAAIFTVPIATVPALAQTFTVSGKVYSPDRSGGVANVRMVFSHPSSDTQKPDPTCPIPVSVLTNSSGIWVQRGFKVGCSYRVKPYQAYRTFRLAYRPFTRSGNSLHFYQNSE